MAASEGWAEDDAALEARGLLPLATGRRLASKVGSGLSRSGNLGADVGSTGRGGWAVGQAAPDAHPAALMAAALQGAGARGRRVPSLQGLSLGCLGEWVEEFLSAGPELLELLTPEHRAALGAVARRRRLLHGATLQALVDPRWIALDLSGSAVVDDDTLLHVLRIPRDLQALDVSRCDRLTAASLRALPELCPALVELRLGGSPASCKSAAAALKRLLPCVREAEEDSWEDASDGDFGGGLTQLRAMYWAEMPLPQQKYVEENCPRLTLRTTDARPPGSVPPEPGSRCPWPALDLPLAEAVGPAAWRALHQQADAALAAREVPIAERFKAAIDEAELIAANKAAAAAKKALRQRIKKCSVTAAHEAWLDADVL